MQQITKKPIYHALALAALLAALTAVVSLSMARAKEPLAQTNSGPGPCTECDCDGYVGAGPQNGANVTRATTNTKLINSTKRQRKDSWCLLEGSLVSRDN